MSIEKTRQAVHDYIARTRWASLAIVREDGAPTIRPIGSFAPAGGGVDVFFATPRDSAKARVLARNPRVNFYFQHEGQAIASYRGVSIIGEARVVEPGSEDFCAAVALIAARSQHFNGLVERGELDGMCIYRVKAVELRYSDYAESRGIQELRP
ncbi:MAG: pyridoxamine 5'-phosphate oxidase family protein [Puniceicoccales bacterium]|jgi:nitroimidazol reductase NimA-like FMN-containing flavoprotein (pyridoxamine 5'-phosphate oxidase superfamily)|nr:pyridoxamine 5'-phosphate oxidase family protein [Puniceicoccales bacterium]